MTFSINQKVRIRGSPDYSYDERFPCLESGTEGRVTNIWSRNGFGRQEVHYHVKFGDGSVYPFFAEELEKV